MGWFSRKEQSGKPSLDSDRYAGRPLLILLENYVLDCIGHLPVDKSSSILTAVQRVYGGGDDWKATLRATLQLGDSLDDSLRRMWDNNQEIAKRDNQTLAPEEFARLVVDQNFADLIG